MDSLIRGLCTAAERVLTKDVRLKARAICETPSISISTMGSRENLTPMTRPIPTDQARRESNVLHSTPTWQQIPGVEMNTVRTKKKILL